MSEKRKSWVKPFKECTSSALLMTLILQMGIASLLCATSSYQANASALTICSPIGLKNITIDENGDPVENDQQHSAFQKMCFHCATGCGMAGLLPADHLAVAIRQSDKHIIPNANQLETSHLATGPPSRAPPLSS